jgi:hypothetical protein
LWCLVNSRLTLSITVTSHDGQNPRSAFTHW